MRRARGLSGLPPKPPDTHVSCFVVSEGTGWAARLRRVVNARMEEMSFRSGLAVFAAVLALTGTGIALTVTLGGGHRAAAAPLTASRSVTPSPVAPPSSASAAPSLPASPSASQAAPESAPAVANEDAPQPETTKAPSPQASPASSSPWPTPRPLPSRTLGPEQPPETTPPGWWPPGWPWPPG